MKFYIGNNSFHTRDIFSSPSEGKGKTSLSPSARLQDFTTPKSTQCT